MPSTQSSEWFSGCARMYLDWMSRKIERLRTASGNRYLDFSAALWDKWANNMRLHCPTLHHNINILSVTKSSVFRKVKHREVRILGRYFPKPYSAIRAPWPRQFLSPTIQYITRSQHLILRISRFPQNANQGHGLSGLANQLSSSAKRPACQQTPTASCQDKATLCSSS